MTRALLSAFALTACTAQATQPAPCVQPATKDERIELRGSEDVTSAALEALYGIGLEGKAQ